jgi:NAD(P)-dependent dehydrogenase (short-subunit alcohol dehydrogenase family)
MDLQLTDKVAIVTGSSKGLGLASRARFWPRARASRFARGAVMR